MHRGMGDVQKRVFLLKIFVSVNKNVFLCIRFSLRNKIIIIKKNLQLCQQLKKK